MESIGGWGATATAGARRTAARSSAKLLRSPARGSQRGSAPVESVTQVHQRVGRRAPRAAAGCRLRRLAVMQRQRVAACPIAAGA